MKLAFVTVNNKITINPDTDVIVKFAGGLTGVFTKFGDSVFEWCSLHDIDADLLGSWYEGNWYDGNYCSAWQIKDPNQRMLFVLRWVT